jgi:hypothetical protein
VYSSRVRRGIWSYYPLAKRHKRDDFCCGAEPLDRYLKTQASQDMRRGVAAPYVAAPDDNTVIAYYTLSAFKIELTDQAVNRKNRWTRTPALYQFRKFFQNICCNRQALGGECFQIFRWKIL